MRSFAGHLAPPASTHSERDRDRELISRVAHGEVRALRALYDVHAPRAMAVAMRVLKDQADAEDVVQETFIELWKRASQYDARRGGAVAWVVTIARSRAIDRLRAGSSASRAVDAAANDVDRPKTPEPQELAEQGQDRHRIRAALWTLPPKQRAAIELAYFDGLTQSEIARKMGEPLGTVKMRVRLAMAKLAALLREDNVKEGGNA